MSDLLEFNLTNRGVTTKFAAPTGIYSLVLTSNVAKITLPCGSATASNLAFEADTAKWVLVAAKKLEALGKLGRNWDSHDGLPLSAGARLMTFDALGWLRKQDLPVPAVVLDSAGTVHLEWRSHGKKLEIGFDDRETIEYLKVDKAGSWEEEENVNTDVRKKLESLAEWLRNS
jgi:hypothetical protein